MLPGAAPPVKEPEVVAVGFDEPAEVRTLHSAGKVSVTLVSKVKVDGVIFCLF